jgi:hypothetical protein
MFKLIADKKRQLDNLISIANWIKDLKSEFDDWVVHIIINSDFHITFFDFYFLPDEYYLKHKLPLAINNVFDDMKIKIQVKTKSVLNSKH